MPIVGRTAALYLILGILINIAIAWLMVLPLDRYMRWDTQRRIAAYDSGPVTPSDCKWQFTRFRRWGLTQVTASPAFVTNTPTGGIGPYPLTATVPRWSRINKPPPPARSDQVRWRIEEQAYGWPLRSLITTYLNEPRHVGDSHLNVVDGLPIRRLTQSFTMGREIIALPTKPIWIGLFVNSLCYAMATFILSNGIGRARRRWRTTNGYCPLCGYDIGGAVNIGCPECGWNRRELESS